MFTIGLSAAADEKRFATSSKPALNTQPLSLARVLGNDPPPTPLMTKLSFPSCGIAEPVKVIIPEDGMVGALSVTVLPVNPGIGSVAPKLFSDIIAPDFTTSK